LSETHSTTVLFKRSAHRLAWAINRRTSAAVAESNASGDFSLITTDRAGGPKSFCS
jgi:hypothetical protein